ncbi:hypothetical protein [Izhakiella capsodis]|nr:hypothetical protein [Izhakiella capsodis]
MRDELSDVLPEQSEDGIRLSMPTDLVRGVLIGTSRTVDGDNKNRFKRGTDTFPLIDRDCFVIDAANSQKFMGIPVAEYTENERVKLGYFVAGRKAEAVIRGDKFFPRPPIFM